MREIEIPINCAPVGDLNKRDQSAAQPTKHSAKFKHFTYQMINWFNDPVTRVVRERRLE